MTPHLDACLLHLSFEVPKLTLDIVKAADLFSESALEGGRLGIEVAELDDAEFTECCYDGAADIVGDVELGEAHGGGAEEGIFGGHAGRDEAGSETAQAFAEKKRRRSSKGRRILGPVDNGIWMRGCPLIDACSYLEDG